MNESIAKVPVLSELGEYFLKEGFSLFLVGGYVRNSIMSLSEGDLDVCSRALPNEVKAICIKNNLKIIDKAIDLGTVEIHLVKNGKRFVFEHTTFRQDYYSAGGDHRPKKVVFTDDMKKDALRRDFTINALYQDANTDKIIDPLNRGISDIQKKIIAACQKDAELTIRDDGLRIMRMVRFACELNFDIDEDLLNAAKENIFLLKDISKERIRDEFIKILMSDLKYEIKRSYSPVKKGIDLLLSLGAFKYIFNGFGKEIYFNEVVTKFSEADLYTRLASFFESMEEKEVKGYLLDLRFDNKTIKSVCELIKFLKTDVQYKENKIRQVAASMGKEQFLRLCVLFEAKQPKENKIFRETLDRMLSEGAPFSESELDITGQDIMDVLNISAGQQVGRIKRELLNICIKDPKQNKKNILIKHAKNIFKVI